MKLLEWLQVKLLGESFGVLTISKEEADFAGLNMSQAIDAHMAWRIRLADILDGKSHEELNVGEVARDDCCSLGKWLFDSARLKFGSYQEYETLRKNHSRFHICAGEILVLHNIGQFAAAKQMLRADLRNLSDLVQLDIVRLYAAVNK